MSVIKKLTSFMKLSTGEGGRKIKAFTKDKSFTLSAPDDSIDAIKEIQDCHQRRHEGQIRRRTRHHGFPA